MPASTVNKNGRISISDEAIARLTHHIASECYGVVELVSRSFTDSFLALFNKDSLNKGVKVVSTNNKLYIDIFVVLKYGVTVTAVVDSLKSAVVYGVEYFSGMIVKEVNVHVVGMRV